MDAELRDDNGLTEEEFLKQYDPDRYEKPAVTADMLIFTADPAKDFVLELLMIQRKGHPYIGKWAIPGGFVEMNESVDAAAARELEEETGLKDIYMEQLYTFGEVERDPRMRVISVAYMALLAKDRLKPVAGDDAVAVRWFTVHWDDKNGRDRLWLESEDGTIILQEDDIAFDHEQVIKTALRRLRNKVEYTDIAFELVGESFTLTKLQTIYESILGRELHKPNFRRSIARQVEKTDQKERGGASRPAYLYRKKEMEVSRYE